MTCVATIIYISVSLLKNAGYNTDQNLSRRIQISYTAILTYVLDHACHPCIQWLRTTTAVVAVLLSDVMSSPNATIVKIVSMYRATTITTIIPGTVQYSTVPVIVADKRARKCPLSCLECCPIYLVTINTYLCTSIISCRRYLN